MTVYNLYDGGNALHQNCKDCENGNELPVFLQPDLRADGGYGFRHKLHWQHLMANLQARYNKSEEELKVGDRLRIFVQPNHATLKNLFIDFKYKPNGFVFTFENTRGDLKLNELEGYKDTYDGNTLEVLDVSAERMKLEALLQDGTAITHTQISFIPDELKHNVKVDAIELVIKSLPAKGFAGTDIWFARRFEQDGLHI